jgi:hypothetical protein
MNVSITILSPNIDISKCGIAKFALLLTEEINKTSEAKLLPFNNKINSIDPNSILVFNYPGLGLYGNWRLMMALMIFRLRGGKILMVNHEEPRSLKENKIYLYLWSIANIIISPRPIKLNKFQKFIIRKKRIINIPNFSMLLYEEKEVIKKDSKLIKSCCTFGYIHRNKKIEYLIQFAAYNNLEITVIGNVKDLIYMNELKVLAEKKKVQIHFSPYVEDEELYSILTDHDFTIFYGNISDISWSTTIQAAIEKKLITILIHEMAVPLNINNKIFMSNPDYEVSKLFDLSCSLDKINIKTITRARYAKKISKYAHQCLTK